MNIICEVMNFRVMALITPSIYISLYKCCICKIDIRLRLADCDLQQ